MIEAALHEPDRRILLVGPYPPPLGGISTHVRRLSRTLTERGFIVEVVNHYGRHPDPVVVDYLNKRALLYWYRLRKRAAPVVHYHHGGRVFTLLAAAAARGRGRTESWVVTIHGHGLRPFLRAELWPLRETVRWSLRRFDAVVAVSVEVGEWLHEFEPRLNITVVPAYIPPAKTELGRGDDELARFVTRGPGTMVVSAYRIRRWRDGGDLYGVDTAVALLEALARLGYDVRLLVFLAHPPRGRWARRHWKALLTHAQAPGLSSRFSVRVGEELLPALRPNVIYLRPTRIDGDAVSVREALDLGVRVFASDVVSRPAGARTLPTTDLSAWTAALVDELGRCTQIDTHTGSDTAVDQLTALYGRLAYEPSGRSRG